MNIEETKKYYDNIKREDLCQCVYCQNLADEIKTAYPEVSDYLMTLGIDIEKPFEVFLPSEPAGGYMDYYGVQYLIAGDSTGFIETKIGDIEIYITDCHPSATHNGDYFVMQAGTFHIRANTDKYDFE